MSKVNLPFNIPYVSGNEFKYIKQAIDQGYVSGNGNFTKRCQNFFEKKYGYKKCLLTTSCTDALEMCALLMNIGPGDEVIIPAYTFVSTANAFVLRGAKIVFADSKPDEPNLDVSKIASLITHKTKAIVAVHYAGVAVDMQPLLTLANKHNLLVVEDCAHAIDSYYYNKPLGSLGHLAAFSFHKSKNIISGEGGMLVVNDDLFLERAEIIWEKGTNRNSFFKGEIDQYGWLDVGSSFSPSDILAAFLYAQLESIETIQSKRKEIWARYYSNLLPLQQSGKIQLPVVPQYATNNAHLFYVLCKGENERDNLIKYLYSKGVHAVFHYLPLQDSQFYKDKHDGRVLKYANRYSTTLVRLPFYFNLTLDEVDYVSDLIHSFFEP